MKIGIMCATQQELDPLLARLQNKRTTERLMRSFVTGEYAGVTVVAVVGGVGKVNGAITAQELIQEFGVEKLIFTGLAGGAFSFPACSARAGGSGSGGAGGAVWSWYTCRTACTLSGASPAWRAASASWRLAVSA